MFLGSEFSAEESESVTKFLEKNKKRWKSKSAFIRDVCVSTARGIPLDQYMGKKE